VGVIAVVAITVGALRPLSGGGGSGGGAPDNGAPTSLAKVARRSLFSRTQVDGMLRFAGSYTVVNGSAGVVTTLPRVGQVIRRGRVLYRVAGKPIVLLYGRTPSYRVLKVGMSGADVEQLNVNLVVLGYATGSALDPTSDYFSAATKRALERLQAALGAKQTGQLELGRAVFLPGAARITKVMATLGASAQPGTIVAEASSTRPQVAVDLDATQQASVKVGDRVVITLPNGRAARGVVTSVGRVADSAKGSSGSATVPVRIAPRNPKAIRSLDRASVQVAITTGRVRRALVVPVTALLALAGGGYAVETVDADGVHRLVRVKLGLFDDADGLVAVSGSLSPGQRIVVPGT
jgi:Putative peptidoglycan binding domain